MPYDEYGNYSSTGRYTDPYSAPLRPKPYDYPEIEHPPGSYAKGVVSFVLLWAFFILGAIFALPSLISMFF